MSTIDHDALQESHKSDSSSNPQRLQEKVLNLYKQELNCPSSTDLGLHGVTRAELRTLCRDSILKSTKSLKKKNSFSNNSSSIKSIVNDNSALGALRLLQKERLIASRLGFPDKAMELDKAIEAIREQAKSAKEEEEKMALNQRMRVLAIAQSRKERRLEAILAEETRLMNEKFQEEEEKMLKRQEVEFLKVLENATNRAMGRAKKCNCATPYTCKHNKTASYNTRRPTYVVVQYRRNAERLKQAGRPEEAVMWEGKAKELDDEEQEKWLHRIAESIVSSPWGANEAAVDHVTEVHKRELQVLRKTHSVKRDMHERKQAMRRKNFQSTMLAEQRKVRMQCRKQGYIRLSRDYEKEMRDMEKVMEWFDNDQQEEIDYEDGLSNDWSNELLLDHEYPDKRAVDRIMLSATGLHHTMNTIELHKEIGTSNAKQSDVNSSTNSAKKRSIDASIQEFDEKILAKMLSSKKELKKIQINELSISKTKSSVEQKKIDQNININASKEFSQLAITTVHAVNDLPNNYISSNKNDSIIKKVDSVQEVDGGAITVQPVARNILNTVPMTSDELNATPWDSPCVEETVHTRGRVVGLQEDMNHENKSQDAGTVLFPSPLKPIAPSSPVPSMPSFRSKQFQSNNININAAVIGIAIHSPPTIYHDEQTFSNPIEIEIDQMDIPPLTISHSPVYSHTNSVSQEITSSKAALTLTDSETSEVAKINHNIEEDKSTEVKEGNNPMSPASPIQIELVTSIDDESYVIPFKPKSVKDEDWMEYDKSLEARGGEENSYGVPLLSVPSSLMKEKVVAIFGVADVDLYDKEGNTTKTVYTPRSPTMPNGLQSSRPHIRPYTPVPFRAGNQPPRPGTPDSIPLKSALKGKSIGSKKKSNASIVSTGSGVSSTGSSNSARHVKFGQEELQTFPTPAEDTISPESSPAKNNKGNTSPATIKSLFTSPKPQETIEKSKESADEAHNYPITSRELIDTAANVIADEVMQHSLKICENLGSEKMEVITDELTPRELMITVDAEKNKEAIEDKKEQGMAYSPRVSLLKEINKDSDKQSLNNTTSNKDSRTIQTMSNDELINKSGVEKAEEVFEIMPAISAEEYLFSMEQSSASNTWWLWFTRTQSFANLSQSFADVLLDSEWFESLEVFVSTLNAQELSQFVMPLSLKSTSSTRPSTAEKKNSRPPSTSSDHERRPMSRGSNTSNTSRPSSAASAATSQFSRPSSHQSSEPNSDFVEFDDLDTFSYRWNQSQVSSTNQLLDQNISREDDLDFDYENILQVEEEEEEAMFRLDTEKEDEKAGNQLPSVHLQLQLVHLWITYMTNVIAQPAVEISSQRIKKAVVTNSKESFEYGKLFMVLEDVLQLNMDMMLTKFHYAAEENASPTTRNSAEESLPINLKPLPGNAFVTELLQQQEACVHTLFTHFAKHLFPAYLLSEDFASYCTHTNHNTSITIDSPNWLDIYQQSTEEHSIAMLLVSMQTNQSPKHIANVKMRQMIGPLCEASNPFEYFSTLLAEGNNPDASSQLLHSWQRGEDIQRLSIHTLFASSPDASLSSLEGHLTLKYIRVKDELKYCLWMFMKSVQRSEDDSVLMTIIEGISSSMPSSS